MRAKANGDSILAGLDAGQRYRVDQWLFEENCTYKEVMENCRREFQKEVSIASVGRYFRREYQERVTDRYARRAVEEEETLKALGKSRDVERSYRVILRMAEFVAAREAMKPEGECDFRKVGYLMRVIIAAREEANEGERVQLMREKFEYSASAAALAELPYAKEMEIEDMAREDERIEAIKKRLFGTRLPKSTWKQEDEK